MSPRAAWRLESLGFTDAHDFVPGKAAWLAMGWPSEGDLAGDPTVGTFARNVPVACPGETVGDAKRRCAETGLDLCLVVNEANIFMGRLRQRSLQEEPAVPVEQAMEAGSSTVRPSESLDALAQRMDERKIPSVVVTNLKGRLVGALLLEDAQKSICDSGDLGAVGLVT